MKLQGIEVSKEEVRAFQKVFPSSLAAQLLDKILMAMVKDIEERLHNPVWSDTNMRVHQGMALTIQEIDKQIGFFLKVDLDQVEDEVKEEGEEAQVEEEAPDVRF